ncbi:GNAT family N-acetyltransferase [Nocardiopsis ganjiahuensis]|uniref:GNAT family N-acetyltransferase n=1 Tax=Nocardiopsis ganjiahuensis TaxID=239984 RepID=UPI00034BB509|nr:GNAT family N-acetyltransferase [Nocardiopsis ganjiahuensis]
MEIKRLNKGEEGRAIAVLAEAMYDDPVLSWLFPDPEGRTRAMPYAMGHFTSRAMATDRVLMDGADQAASLWFLQGGGAPPATSDEDPVGGGAAPEAFVPYMERLDLLGRIVTERRPAEPHLYLSVIGTLPEARGRGLGGALLGHRLSDNELPAYLEASSPRSRELYLRHGFEPHGDPIRLPDGPTVYPMRRPAP